MDEIDIRYAASELRSLGYEDQNLAVFVAAKNAEIVALRRKLEEWKDSYDRLESQSIEQREADRVDSDAHARSVRAYGPNY
jgi:hypothetical protein